MRWRSARRRRPQGGKPEHHAPIPAVLDPVHFAGRLRNSACQITHSHHAFASIVVHLDHENMCAADHAAHKPTPAHAVAAESLGTTHAPSGRLLRDFRLPRRSGACTPSLEGRPPLPLCWPKHPTGSRTQQGHVAGSLAKCSGQFNLHRAKGVDDKPSTILSGGVATCTARTSRCTSVPTGEGRGLRIALRYCR